MVLVDRLGLVNFSVEPHQMITRRSAPEVFLKLPDVLHDLLGEFHLGSPVFRLFGCSLLTHFCSKAAVIGWMVSRKALSCSTCRVSSTPALSGRFVGIVA